MVMQITHAYVHSEMLNFLIAENQVTEKLQNKYAIIQAMLSLLPSGFFPVSLISGRI